MGYARAPLTKSYIPQLLALTVQKRYNQGRLVDALLIKLTLNNFAAYCAILNKAGARQFCTSYNNSYNSWTILFYLFSNSAILVVLSLPVS